jgi:hypothetical protein
MKRPEVTVWIGVEYQQQFGNLDFIAEHGKGQSGP